MDQLRQVIDVVGHRVVAGRRPGGVTVSPQVRSDHMKIFAHIGGDPVPVPAVIAPAMQQDQRRRVGIAPVHVVQPQSLGKIYP
jgi:hypothetical protein